MTDPEEGPAKIFSFSARILPFEMIFHLLAVYHSSTTFSLRIKRSGFADSSKFLKPCNRWFF